MKYSSVAEIATIWEIPSDAVKPKRKKEKEKLYSSKQVELVAIYGRRRIGKTYLVDER